jgi:hypothetical protein
MITFFFSLDLKQNMLIIEYYQHKGRQRNQCAMYENAITQLHVSISQHPPKIQTQPCQRIVWEESTSPVNGQARREPHF